MLPLPRGGKTPTVVRVQGRKWVLASVGVLVQVQVSGFTIGVGFVFRVGGSGSSL